MKFILLALFPIFANAAEDMNSCMMIKNQNERNFCLAKYSGSAAFCDKILIYEKRYDCQRMVIRKQRENR